MERTDMNLREWARATHKRIAGEPTMFHRKEISINDVEMIISQSIQVLTEALRRGDDLRLHELGRFWVEQKPAYTAISNLPGQKKSYDVNRRRVLRFRVSAKLAATIMSTNKAVSAK